MTLRYPIVRIYLAASSFEGKHLPDNAKTPTSNSTSCNGSPVRWIPQEVLNWWDAIANTFKVFKGCRYHGAMCRNSKTSLKDGLLWCVSDSLVAQFLWAPSSADQVFRWLATAEPVEDRTGSSEPRGALGWWGTYQHSRRLFVNNTRSKESGRIQKKGRAHAGMLGFEVNSINPITWSNGTSGEMGTQSHSGKDRVGCARIHGGP